MVARVVLRDGDFILKKIDSVKEQVKLADGLNCYKELTEPYLLKAIRCLTRFSERLRSFSPESVRVVGTNTFRVAKNIGVFLPKFEKALGFPINVISGVEEARLIYKGVCNSWIQMVRKNWSLILAVDQLNLSLVRARSRIIGKCLCRNIKD